MDDPKVIIGGRVFTVPEFSIKSQRKVTPALMRVAGTANDIGNEETFGDMLDTVFLCLTIEGANEISKDEFEGLRTGPLHMATDVLPVLLKQAGLQPETKAGPGGAGAAGPDTPLSGETTSTT